MQLTIKSTIRLKIHKSIKVMGIQGSLMPEDGKTPQHFRPTGGHGILLNL